MRRQPVRGDHTTLSEQGATVFITTNWHPVRHQTITKMSSLNTSSNAAFLNIIIELHVGTKWSLLPILAKSHHTLTLRDIVGANPIIWGFNERFKLLLADELDELHFPSPSRFLVRYDYDELACANLVLRVGMEPMMRWFASETTAWRHLYG